MIRTPLQLILLDSLWLCDFLRQTYRVVGVASCISDNLTTCPVSTSNLPVYALQHAYFALYAFCHGRNPELARQRESSYSGQL